LGEKQPRSGTSVPKAAIANGSRSALQAARPLQQRCTIRKSYRKTSAIGNQALLS
jgi:hypothetical protein